MNTLSMLCVAVSVSLILALATEARAAPWRVSDQPCLKQQLEQAPLLKTESLGLGELARGPCSPW